MRLKEPDANVMARVRALVKEGASVPKIMRLTGLTEAPARRIIQRERKALGVPTMLTHHNANAMAGVEEQILEGYQSAVKQESRLRLKQRQQVRTIKLPNEICGIAFLADIHLGGNLTDYEALDRDIDTILATPGLYVILGGDGIDNHIKHLAAMVAQRITPKDQWAWYGEMLKRVTPKLLAVVGGNHEAWTLTLTGYDPLKPLVKLLDIPYDPNGMSLDVQVGKTHYDLCVRHKYRFNSSQNASHSVKRMWEQFKTYDIGVVCDKHEYTCEPFDRDGKMRWAMRPGAYQVTSSYGEAGGFRDAVPTSPVILLSPDTYNAHGFISVAWGAQALTGLRGAKHVKR